VHRCLFCQFWFQSGCPLHSPAHGRVVPVLISVVLDRLRIPPSVLIDLAFNRVARKFAPSSLKQTRAKACLFLLSSLPSCGFRSSFDPVQERPLPSFTRELCNRFLPLWQLFGLWLFSTSCFLCWTKANDVSPRHRLFYLCDFNFCSWCVGIVARIHPGHTPELPDQKTQDFWVQITLTRQFLEHAHKVFDEMSVRT
jgi:hypothetical protein